VAAETLAEILSVAVEHHKAGRLAEAEAIYRAILEGNPRHSDAWHLLGVIASESGNHQAAVAAIGRAIRLRPSATVYYSNLGLAFARQQDWERAAIAYRQAIRMQPANGTLQLRLAKVLEAAGRLEEAEPHYAEAAKRLDTAEAWFAWGNALHNLERYAEAARAYARSIELEPQHAAVHFNLGGSLGKLGCHQEAESCLREALLRCPEFPAAENNLGAALQAQGRLEEAERAYRNALVVKPDYVDALYNLGFALQLQDKLEEALDCYDLVLRGMPRHTEARTNRANTFLLMGRPAEALSGYEEVLSVDPEHVEAHWNRALLWLQTGDWGRGWQEYEWRFRQKDYTPREYAGPRWGGEPLQGATILVHAEQGLGDTIQFVRFLAPLKQLGCRVIFECQPRLKTLLAGVGGIDVLITREEPRPDYDCHIELMSLPCRLGTKLETLPADVPYLRAPVPPRGADGTRRIGLIWSGNPDNKTNRRRSLRLADLAPLAALPGVALYSLQRGEAAAELAAAPFPIVNLEQESGQVADTAAAMMGLDLVISVDTMTAHLAGALARPVWLLLPYSADWRWLAEREDSPWYPTMRLFRQRRRGDWAELISRVAGCCRSAG
jgi:tetratricopeptide (TPR) repeat protein